MSDYKEVIKEFLEEIEELDIQCNFDNLSKRDVYLFNIIRNCRNKLAEAYNCIGDEAWVLPDLR